MVINKKQTLKWNAETILLAMERGTFPETLYKKFSQNNFPSTSLPTLSSRQGASLKRGMNADRLCILAQMQPVSCRPSNPYHPILTSEFITIVCESH